MIQNVIQRCEISQYSNFFDIDMSNIALYSFAFDLYSCRRCRRCEVSQILGSVKLHIGDSWGKMKTFALGNFHGETQTLGGW